MTAERAESIRELLASGLSRRAIAARLGISDRTVRNVLAAQSAPTSGAEFPDYIPPGEGRVVPTPTRDELLFQGGVSHPGKAWIPCPSCHHPAWRDAPGVDAWTCACPVGPRSCHGPTQVADADGVPQIVYGPYRIRPFGLPPEAT